MNDPTSDALAVIDAAATATPPAAPPEPVSLSPLPTVFGQVVPPAEQPVPVPRRHRLAEEARGDRDAAPDAEPTAQDPAWLASLTAAEQSWLRDLDAAGRILRAEVTRWQATAKRESDFLYVMQSFGMAMLRSIVVTAEDPGLGMHWSRWKLIVAALKLAKYAADVASAEDGWSSTLTFGVDELGRLCFGVCEYIEELVRGPGPLDVETRTPLESPKALTDQGVLPRQICAIYQLYLPDGSEDVEHVQSLIQGTTDDWPRFSIHKKRRQDVPYSRPNFALLYDYATTWTTVVKEFDKP